MHCVVLVVVVQHLAELHHADGVGFELVQSSLHAAAPQRVFVEDGVGGLDDVHRVDALVGVRGRADQCGGAAKERVAEPSSRYGVLLGAGH